MNLRKLLRSQYGFSLIEVLASIVIFTIVTFSMMQFFSSAFSYTIKNQDTNVGVYAAQNMLNYLQKQNFKLIFDKYNKLIPTASKDSYYKLDISSCQDKVASTEESVLSFTKDGQSDASDPEDRKSTCERVFTPIINNRPFKITVQLYRYPAKSASDPVEVNTAKSIIPVLIIVKWDNKTKELEGSIVNENIR